MFEPRNSPLLTRSAFLRRFLISVLVALLFLALSLLIGMVGYHHFEKLSWLDSYYNASMILSGMGPVDPMQTAGGKIFAGLYALFSGVALLANAGIIFAPVAHRLYHKFHLADSDTDEN